MSSQQRGIKFNDHETTRFLELYSMEKVLYDPTLDDYRDRDLRAAAANRISRELNIPGLGPKEVIVKFKNLRSSYCQELKKISDSVRSANGTDDVYKPKVFWFEQMNSFIRPFVQQRPTQSNLAFSKNKFEEAPIENSRPSESEFECSASKSSEDTSQSCSSKIDTPRKMVKRKIGPQPSRSKNKNAARNHETVFTRGEQLLQEPSNRATEVAASKCDSYDHFGKYIASMLRDIGPPTAIRLQQNITNAITNAILCQPFVTYDKRDEEDV